MFSASAWSDLRLDVSQQRRQGRVQGHTCAILHTSTAAGVSGAGSCEPCEPPSAERSSNVPRPGTLQFCTCRLQSALARLSQRRWRPVDDSHLHKRAVYAKALSRLPRGFGPVWHAMTSRILPLESHREEMLWQSIRGLAAGHGTPLAGNSSDTASRPILGS